MNKVQKDLLKVCINKKIKSEYAEVRAYAYNFKKYDNLTMRQIDEIVKILSEKK